MRSPPTASSPSRSRSAASRTSTTPSGRGYDVANPLGHVNAVERAGEELVGIYHSHPDCDAYFSTTDLKNSCPWYSFVVLSVKSGEFDHANSWLPNVDQTEAAKEELIY